MAIIRHIPLLFTLSAVAVFCMLGTWQTQRLAWKQNLLAQIEKAQAQPALEILPDDLGESYYRNVSLQGTFTGSTLHLVGRMQGQELGYFMLTPFLLPDGRAILVNRGYSPPDKDNTPMGKATVAGVLRPLREKRFFAPENQPEKNLWFYEDTAQLSGFLKVNLLPGVVELTGKKEPGRYPIPNSGKISLRNDHLGYAVTWFSLAGVALLMYGFYRRNPRH
jgi:surfeit locus 1 family protein